jgi:hypothetical protein
MRMTVKEVSSLFSAIAEMSGKVEGGSRSSAVHLRGNVRMVCAWNLSQLQPIVARYQEERREKMAELAESCRLDEDDDTPRPPGQDYDQQTFSRELAAWEKEAAEARIDVSISQCRLADLDLDNNPSLDHVMLFNLVPMIEDWQQPGSSTTADVVPMPKRKGRR